MKLAKTLSKVVLAPLLLMVWLPSAHQPQALAAPSQCPKYICGSTDTADDAFNVSGKRTLKVPTRNPKPRPTKSAKAEAIHKDQMPLDSNRVITISQSYCFTLDGVGQMDCFEIERTRCTQLGSQLVIRAGYPANDISAIERSGAPFCSEPSDPVISDPAEAEPEAPPMPVVTLADFRRLDIAPSTIESDSGGFGLIRANTNFYATEEPQTLNTTMLGQQVAIQAIPVQWTFTYGDGSAPLVSTTPGGPQREFNQETTTSHAYQQTGTFQVTVATAYRGQFSVNGGPWIAIPGTASVPSTPVEADIWRSEAKNVAEDCHQNPDGWACANPFVED
jgi:hypothetical protein